ncbi:serine hydrolase domain-containing protein [Halomonas denitrificans]|nr:beta-lactamase family protein [Halomonas denitrificans]
MTPKTKTNPAAAKGGLLFALSAGLLIGLIAVAGLSRLQAAPRDDATAPADLERLVPALMERTRVPGLAIARIESGRVAWQAAFGQRAPGHSMTTDTVFNAASLTKPVFAATVLGLVEDDVLALDQSLEALWVDPDVAEDPRHADLTPRILLSHQSGLPNWRRGEPLRFLFAPGARHEYSGEGFEYLRRPIEQATGASIRTLTAEQVFEPAGMRSSSMGWSDDIGDKVARGFDEAGEPIETHLERRGPNAAAHLMTTVGDYARFLAWVAGGAGLSPELFQAMRTPQALHEDPAELFGLGWKLIPLGNAQVLMHDGREPGVRTYAVIDPDRGDGLVILTGSSNGALLVRPLVRAALEHGDAIVESSDRLVWRYLAHLPPQALEPMSRGIARSPSFLATLLHAVDTVLVQSSPLPAADRAAASEAVGPYVHALHEGRIEPEQVQRLVEQLLIDDGDGLRLVDRFDDRAARAWLTGLQDIGSATSRRFTPQG